MRREVFQPTRGRWQEHARLGIRGVLDPDDTRGFKNRYLDVLTKAAVKRQLNLAGHETVLDFGCGIGRLTPLLAEKAKRVVGLDAFEEMIESAKKINPGPNITYLSFDGINIPFPEDFFDLVLSVWVFQYAIRDYSTFLEMVKEVSRVLKKNGRIILIEQAYRSAGGETFLPKNYISAFAKQGCRPLVYYPIRNGGTSIVASFAYRGWIPAFLLPWCVTLERWLINSERKQAGIVKNNSYFEFVSVLLKSEDRP